MIITLNFSFIKHPLAMSLILIIQTLFICFNTGLKSNSYWFSYILFLIFLGGMLVLFIYIASLASNEMFNISFKLIMFSIILFIFMLLLISYTSEINLDMFHNKLTLNSSLKENSMIIYKLYNVPTNLVTIMMVNYLLFTLIVTVKITFFFSGPLRNLN